MAEQLDLEQIRGDLAERAQQAADEAVKFAQARPHLAVGLALGVGWILGNGLPPRVVMAAARLGWKAMLGSALASSGLLGVLGEAAQDAGERPRGGANRRPRAAAARPE